MLLHISRWIVALVLYTNIVLVLLVFKPALLFDAEGNSKPFGVGLREGQSVFAPAIVFPVIALICYLIASWIHVVWI